MMPQRGCLNFLNLFRNFLAEVQCKRNSGLKFFSPFLGLSHSVLAKNIAGKRLFIILNFYAFVFRNFLNRVEYERNSGLKTFSPFLGLSHPVLAKNNVGKRFFIILNFFAIFIGIFLIGSRVNGIRG